MSGGPRICIDARLESGQAGGIEQVVIGLANGLSALVDGDERYVFLCYPGADDWLTPHLGPNCEVLHTRKSWQKQLRRSVARRYPGLKRRLEAIAGLSVNRAVNIPASNGDVEAASIDLVHFTLQAAFLTEIPSIYHPHDLQHIHLPEYFSDYEKRGRSLVYQRFCEQADRVAVASSWVKKDVEKHLGIAADKLCVVPLAPSTAAFDEPNAETLKRVRDSFGLPEAFAFYPAQTWPHKNHLGMIRAAARLRREQGIQIPLVFSGRKTEYHDQLQRELRRLGLEDQVKFLGFVSPEELRSLYCLCRCVVIPTRFEAASFPLWESFLAGAPTACANVTSLPRQAGDAALVFDPDDETDIADCMRRLWQDEDLRDTLAARGRASVSRFTWNNTARRFRAHYRQMLARGLTDDDRALLAAEPLL